MKAHKQTDDTRIALLEQSINNINETMKRMEARFDRLENKIDTGFLSVNKRIDDTNNRMWTNFLWILLFYASTIGVVLTSVYYMINS